ncbi:MAG: hypothetical protein WC916_06755 [Candidatus Woesearchaeota archaeon]
MIEKYWIIKGVFEEEDDNGIPYRWMTSEAKVWLPKKEEKYLTLKLFSPFPDFEQTVTIYLDDKKVECITLLNGWHTYTIEKRNQDTITLKAKKTLPKKIDERILAVRISDIATSETVPQATIDTRKDIACLMQEKETAEKEYTQRGSDYSWWKRIHKRFQKNSQKKR